MSDARKRAEEALAKWEGCRVCQTWKPVRAHALSLASALRALLAEPAMESGSVSTVRSDDPPAKPLPTCGNCGSNFITPAPAPDAVAEAAERLRDIREAWSVGDTDAKEMAKCADRLLAALAEETP